jgi:hypothetical protein
MGVIIKRKDFENYFSISYENGESVIYKHSTKGKIKVHSENNLSDATWWCNNNWLVLEEKTKKK